MCFGASLDSDRPAAGPNRAARVKQKPPRGSTRAEFLRKELPSRRKNKPRLNRIGNQVKDVKVNDTVATLNSMKRRNKCTVILIRYQSRRK